MKKNFLEYRPVPNGSLSYHINERNQVVLKIKRDRICDRVARLLKNTPKATFITLDSFGSYLWQQLDGQKNVEELGGLLEEEFGESVYPLEERLVLFLRSLRDNNLIWFRT